jgi:hypothetical protein
MHIQVLLVAISLVISALATPTHQQPEWLSNSDTNTKPTPQTPTVNAVSNSAQGWLNALQEQFPKNPSAWLRAIAESGKSTEEQADIYALIPYLYLWGFNASAQSAAAKPEHPAHEFWFEKMDKIDPDRIESQVEWMLSAEFWMNNNNLGLTVIDLLSKLPDRKRLIVQYIISVL